MYPHRWLIESHPAVLVRLTGPFDLELGAHDRNPRRDDLAARSTEILACHGCEGLLEWVLHGRSVES